MAKTPSFRSPWGIVKICLRKTDRVKVICLQSMTGYKWILKNTAKMKIERAAELILKYLD